MSILKQSTAAILKIGPFVDSTDGVTPEDALTIAQANILLAKNGGSFSAKDHTATATYATAGEGWYTCALNATDCNTAGRMQISVQVTGAVPVWHDFMVYPANVYDSLVAGTDNLEVDTVQFEGTGQIDGVEIATAMTRILAYSNGRISKSGDAYTYYEQDNSTPLFTLNITATGRTRS
jgi:hypothetical protein